MKLKVLILAIFSIIKVSSQQIKVEYTFIKSPIANVKESLYIKENKAICIQDSITNFSNENSSLTSKKFIFPPKISSLLSNNKIKQFKIFDKTNDNNLIFEIEDIVKSPNWEIDIRKTKKILNYNCIKATMEFRGRKFTAYFTKELPYNTGPYKFFGLNGLILEISADNLPYYIWKASSINLDNKDKIIYEIQQKNTNKINIKEFVKIKDSERNKFLKEINDTDIPFSSKVETIHLRPTIEKQYEWETQ